MMIQDRIKIVIGCDYNYFQKATELWKSLRDKPYQVHVMCIGFSFPSEWIGENFVCKRVELEEMKSYRPNFPDNRPFYVCPEGGDFLDFFDYDDDDIIISLDADMIMQRDFTKTEIKILENLQHYEVAGTLSANPPVTFAQEWKNVKAKGDCPDYAIEDENIICAGMIITTAKTYRELIYSLYIKHLDEWMESIRHHALGQLLINCIVHYNAEMVYLNQEMCDAFWYTGTPTSIKDKKLYSGGKLVLFNHTKFDKRFVYGK